ncbi:MAG: glutaminase [Bacteroidales bacterium]|nr:glutaminase [Bacteroidales bacterium]MDD2424629.1 glutaminase [Bacteroidales bacterium]MDD3988697.1 glutaminase [Bacteroidales bacterium]
MGYRDIIERIYSELKDYKGVGEVAGYIPALSAANPDSYGITVATLEGDLISIGDTSDKFTIQSISKVFTFTMVVRLLGEKIWDHVGREPSGNAFNSLIQLELEKGIPRNPFINAGALVVTDKLIDLYENPLESILKEVNDLNCHKSNIEFDNAVALSEIEHSYRNLALVNFIKSYGNIKNDPHKIIETYSYQCSISMNAKELASSFLFLANGGVLPECGKKICEPRSAKRINALMLTCGLYNESGDFAYRVGLPGKSGVGGGVVAVIPGRLAIAVYSPELNANGNSVRGIETLERFTTYLGESVF